MLFRSLDGHDTSLNTVFASLSSYVQNTGATFTGDVTVEGKIMHVIKTLRLYPVVDLVCWLPITIYRTITLIEFAANQPTSTIPDWAWFIILFVLQQGMGLGHALIFFCNVKVRKTLSEYLWRSMCQKQMHPQTNDELNTTGETNKRTIQLTSV